MIDQDCLAALDALQWLRTGQEVYRRFGFSQSSASRKCRHCFRIFGVDLRRVEGEWCVVGDDMLLQLQRKVHQLARWQGLRPLRLEATYWSGPLLCTPAPQRWILGLSNIVGVGRNFQLVRERIVDAFVAGLPDLPAEDDADLTAIALSSMPVFFVARADHPLVGRRTLSFQDIAQYPTLALPEDSYPLVEQALRSIGLWSDPVRMQRYRRDLWEGRAETELTIGYGTPLSMEINGGELVRLPLNLPFDSGEAVVVHRDFAADPELQALVQHLQQRLHYLARGIPELRLISGLP